jgi:hypothetical protein
MSIPLNQNQYVVLGVRPGRKADLFFARFTATWPMTGPPGVRL